MGRSELPSLRSDVTGLVRLHLPALVVLACLALLPPPVAMAQAADPAPSADELRDEYPLRSTVTPAAQTATAEPGPTATAEVAPTATEEPAGAEGSGPSSQEILQLAMAVVVALLAFAGGFALVIRPFRGRSQAEAPATAEPDAVTPAQPLGTPPAPRNAWTAEIEWSPDEAEARFRVVARPGEGEGWSVVAESAPLEWPPTSAEAVADLTAAAEDLERRLVAAGWRPLAPGDAWYARRFEWAPGTPVPAAPGRFERRATAPEGAGEARDRRQTTFEPISTPRGSAR